MNAASPHPSRSRSNPGLRTLLSLLLAGLLSACKVIVIVPPGGKVITEDGFVCLAGETCVIDVFEYQLRQHLHRDDRERRHLPALEEGPGLLLRWQHGALLPVDHGASPATTNLMSILASDDEFFLEPIFIKYDVSYWRQVVAQIKRGTFATRAFLYAMAPIVGQCDPGSLKQNPKSRVVESLNEARKLHRLGGVSYAPVYDSEVQESSLVMRANNRLDHFPDPSDLCYTQAAADAAATSNLAAASGGKADPAADVFLWIDDSFNARSQPDGGGSPPLDAVPAPGAGCLWTGGRILHTQGVRFRPHRPTDRSRQTWSTWPCPTWTTRTY